MKLLIKANPNVASATNKVSFYLLWLQVSCFWFCYLPLDKNQFHKLKVNNKFT